MISCNNAQKVLIVILSGQYLEIYPNLFRPIFVHFKKKLLHSILPPYNIVEKKNM